MRDFEFWADDLFKAVVPVLASKFGRKEYTPYQVYMKALYEYFKDELGGEVSAITRWAVNLAEFQEDAVKKARKIRGRTSGFDRGIEKESRRPRGFQRIGTNGLRTQARGSPAHRLRPALWGVETLAAHYDRGSVLGRQNCFRKSV